MTKTASLRCIFPNISNLTETLADISTLTFDIDTGTYQVLADFHICIRYYLRLHMKIIHIKTPFTFRDMRTWDMWKVCFHSETIECLNLAYFLRILQTSRAYNSSILRINNAKFSEYFFYMNTNIQRDFQICISVPLRIL